MLSFGMIIETGVVIRLNKRQTRHIFRVVRKISYVQKNVPRGHFFLPRRMVKKEKRNSTSSKC